MIWVPTEAPILYSGNGLVANPFVREQEPLKSHRLVLVFLTVVVALTAGGNLRADAADIWSTSEISAISHNSFPQLEGPCLVWQARGTLAGTTSNSDDWEIFLFHIETGVMTQVTDDGYDDISPQTDGDFVVWQKHDRVRTNRIFLYRLHESNPPGGRMISGNDSADHYKPQIAAGRVVWTSQLITESFGPGQIMLYDARNMTGPELVSDSDLDCSSPRIDDMSIVWTQIDGNGTAGLFMYDLTVESPKPEPVHPSFAWEDSPQRDGNLTVLTAHDGTDREVFLYDASLKLYEQITDNDFEDRYPRISGDNIAWVSGEGGASEVYLSADFGSEPPEPEPPSGSSGGGGGSCFIGTAALGHSLP
ncbi:MAG: hypothetical protein SWQ30_05290 [Thermodesulfobacteriota bacterium]|nr:hypothetical protein [Thermodesulfobacteriota bacterium]